MHTFTVASTIIAVSVVFMFLVVLSLISVLFIVGWLHKRKQGNTPLTYSTIIIHDCMSLCIHIDTGSETQTVEQSQNEVRVLKISVEIL